VRLYLTKPDVSRIYEFEIYHRDASPVRLDEEAEGEMPERMELAAAWPNPFNSTAAIRIFVPELMEVRAAIMNSRGQLVAQVANGTLPRGLHTFHWQGRNNAGEAAASGIYYINVLGIDAAGQRSLQVRPVTLVR